MQCSERDPRNIPRPCCLQDLQAQGLEPPVAGKEGRAKSSISKLSTFYSLAQNPHHRRSTLKGISLHHAVLPGCWGNFSLAVPSASQLLPHLWRGYSFPFCSWGFCFHLPSDPGRITHYTTMKCKVLKQVFVPIVCTFVFLVSRQSLTCNASYLFVGWCQLKSTYFFMIEKHGVELGNPLPEVCWG